MLANDEIRETRDERRTKWTAILSICWGVFLLPKTCWLSKFRAACIVFPQPTRTKSR